MADKSKDIEFTSHGDVMLVVGRDNENARYRVSSAILRTASEVFDAMLGSRFSEGQGLGDSNNPKDVKLPEDDPEAMRIICALLHFKSKDVPRTPSCESLSEILKSIDKYFLQEALAFAIQTWCILDGLETIEDLGTKWRALHMLGRPPAMTDITKAFVLNHSACYHTAIGAGVSEEATMYAAALTRKREELRAELSQALYLVVAYDACGCTEQYGKAWFQLTKDRSISPATISTCALSQSLSKIFQPEYPRSDQYSKFCNINPTVHVKIMRMTTDQLEAKFQERINVVKTWDGSLSW